MMSETASKHERVPATLRRYRPLIRDWGAFRSSLVRPLPGCVWANPERIERDALASLLAEDGIASRPVGWHRHALLIDADARPGRHWSFVAGLMHSQEEAALLPVALLDPRPGERVLDLCAAPGNKTAQAALAMGNQGTVVANDPAKGRHAAVRQHVKRLGLLNVAATMVDGRQFPGEAVFDRVLVDAPCSCEGTVRKSPGADREHQPGFRRAQVALQTRLLRRAIALTRPGGRIVYATCTFAPEENEAVVAQALAEHPERLALRPVSMPGLDITPGLSEWQGQRFGEALRATGRLWPHHNDTGGFFVAVLERRADAAVAAASPGTALAEEAAPDRDWLRLYHERFGVPRALTDRVRTLRHGGKYLHIAAADLAPPRRPRPTLAGIPAVRLKALPPKPATAGVLHFGRYATRNRVELEPEEVAAFLRRLPVEVHACRLARCDGHGYVMLHRRGFVLGLGMLSSDEEGNGRIESLFPKAWMVGPEASERSGPATSGR